MGDLFQPFHLLVLLFVFSLFFLVPVIFYLLTLQKALEKCAPASRTLEPGMVWLFLVPLVNIVFHFFIVFGLSKSLSNEFRRRGIALADPQPGQSLGLPMCICACCSIIPLLGFLAGIAHLVLWIMYWIKIAEFSRTLEIHSAMGIQST